MNSEKKEKVYFPNLRQSLGLVIILFLLGVPFFFIRKLLATNNQELNSFTSLWTSLVAQTIIILFGLRIMRKRNDAEYKLKFKRVSIPPLLIIGLMGVSVGIIATIITRFIPMTPKIAEFFGRIYQPYVCNIIRLVIVTPIVEEIFFRGIILEGLLKNYKPIHAIILSAIIFGVSHLNPSQLILATLHGLLIGWVYWKTNSLIPGLVIHCLNNLIATLSLFKLSFNHFVFRMPIVILLIITLIIIFIGFKFLNKKLTTEASLHAKKDG